MTVKTILSPKFIIIQGLFIVTILGFFSSTLNAQPLLSNDTVCQKMTGKVSIGSSIMSTQQGSTLFTTYVAPQINYQVNNKWSIGGGVMISNFSFGGTRLLSNENSIVSLSQNQTQSLLFLNGTYRATNRLTVNAMVYKSMDAGHVFGDQSQMNAFNSNFKGVMFDVNYKITEHTSVNIGFNYSDGGNNPFMQRNSFGSYGFNNGTGGMFGW